MIFTVAIDGPAAAGKGTIGRALAAHFGFAHLDTGLLYRAVGAMGGDPVAAARRLDTADLARDDLRSLDAGQAASRVAAIPEVRAALLEFQRAFARRPGGAVLDGRDIGTVICPEAEVKLYITASAEVRARRRWLELGAAAGPKPYEAVLAEVKERDARDMGRADAPLRAAADAVVFDTSDMEIEATVASAIRTVVAAIERTKPDALIPAVEADNATAIWDEEKASALRGACVLVGMTYCDPDGAVRSQIQYFGIVAAVVPNRGIAIQCQSSTFAGTVQWLPPDLRSFTRAKPGEYRLRTTGETLTDPDFTSTWVVKAPAKV